MSRTMVVTGGAGFVGSHAVEFFADRGWNVVAIDNMSRGEMLGRSGTDTPKYNWNYLSGKNRITLLNASVTDAERMEKLVSNADAVIHTAGQVAVTTSLTDPRRDFETNMLGTFNVLEACRKSGRNPAVIFCSTNKVYGENVNRLPVRLNGDRYEYTDKAFEHGIPESFSVDGCEHTPYGASKLAADLYVQEYSHTYGLKAAVFRMSCIYGTRQFGNEDQGWVAHFILSALRNKKITIYGDGKQVRDVLFVSDLIAAYNAFLESPLKGGLFNMGGGSENTLSLLELVERIEKMTGRRPDISFDEWRNGDQKVYISDIRKAIKQLGWKPKVSVEEGLQRLENWAAGA
ncbi:MAG: GDP-mannose 4,6-dehydratase [Thermoplasmata archaeon YP2-bin.285]|uniref:GDP-mannose 4,6-dehydratase n=1 Tax=Candidatus Sysuiplasma superficiale TaxID=2823368 RepID=A0A8J7YV76_9ARCH|nr:GDP-mannose 4,6-dehydratase [Candidatus Sysuiplasma superficiale]